MSDEIKVPDWLDEATVFDPDYRDVLFLLHKDKPIILLHMEKNHRRAFECTDIVKNLIDESFVIAR